MAPDEVDLASSPLLPAAVDEVRAGHADVRIDMSAVTLFDSAGARVLAYALNLTDGTEHMIVLLGVRRRSVTSSTWPV